jgi:hypothetical protein
MDKLRSGVTAFVLVAATGAGGTLPAGAQTASPVIAQQQPRSPEIVVEAARDPGGPLPTETKANAPSPVRARFVAGKSEQFIRCLRASPAELRSVVDADPGSPGQVYALDKFIRAHQTCYSEFPGAPLPSAPFFGECNPYDVGEGVRYCRSYYDRGALTRLAMRLYAPDLALTPAMWSDPVVQARFNQLETARNARRQIADYRYFETAVCIVRVEPERSLALARSTDNPMTTTRSLLNRARVCVGNAKKVRVDPSQFREYIADAVYRWALAAKARTSLIPA